MPPSPPLTKIVLKDGPDKPLTPERERKMPLQQFLHLLYVLDLFYVFILDPQKYFRYFSSSVLQEMPPHVTLDLHADALMQLRPASLGPTSPKTDYSRCRAIYLPARNATEGKMKKVQGFKKVPNPLYIKFYSSGFTGAELALVLLVFKQTVGWNKETDELAFSQMVKWTRLDPRTVQRARDALIAKGVLIKCSRETSRTAASWRLELDYTKWRVRRGTPGDGNYEDLRGLKDAEPGVGNHARANRPLTKDMRMNTLSKKNSIEERGGGIKLRITNGTKEVRHVSLANRAPRP